MIGEFFNEISLKGNSVPPNLTTALFASSLESRIVNTVGVNAEVPVFGELTGKDETSFRGFMISPDTFVRSEGGVYSLSESGKVSIAELKSLRVNTGRWQVHLVPGTRVEIISQMKDAALKLKSVLPDFQKAGINVIFDIHPVNDEGAFHATLQPADQAKPSNETKVAREAFIQGWIEVSKILKNEKACVAYDILNEPRFKNTFWNTFSENIITAIRTYNDKLSTTGDGKTIILESAYGNADFINDLNVYKTSYNIVYSFHMYHPKEYAGQERKEIKVDANGNPVIGPDGKPVRELKEYLNPYSPTVRKAATDLMDVVKQWQVNTLKRSGISPRVYVGEFSVDRKAEGATEYLQMLIKYFENAKWDYSYHAYKESPKWDLRLGDPQSLIMLQKMFQKNIIRISNGMIVQLVASNKLFIAAEGGGGRELIANRTLPLGWESFKVFFINSNQIALQSWNGQFLSAVNGGGGQVTATGAQIGSNETFTVHRFGDNKIVLQTKKGNYLTINSTTGIVSANTKSITTNERFEFFQFI